MIYVNAFSDAIASVRFIVHIFIFFHKIRRSTNNRKYGNKWSTETVATDAVQRAMKWKTWQWWNIKRVWI